MVMRSINVKNCIFKGNKAVNNVVNGQHCYGGALYASDSTLGIAGSSFTDNFADMGGAICSGEVARLLDFICAIS